MAHKPLRIDIAFSPSTPLREHAYPIHLDDLLAYAYTDQNGGDYRDILLPLGQQDGIYQASALVFPECWGTTEFERKRAFDADVFVDQFGKCIAQQGPGRRAREHQFDTARGQLRTYYWWTPANYVPRAHAWAIGDHEGVEALLGRVSHVGGLTRLGLGEVANITVTEDPAAEENWLLRALPWCPDDEQYLPDQVAVKPPYFKKANQVPGWIHRNIV